MMVPPQARPARIFVLIVMFELRCVEVERNASCSRDWRADDAASAARTDFRLDRHDGYPSVRGTEVPGC